MQTNFFKMPVAQQIAEFYLDMLPSNEELGPVEPTKQFCLSIKEKGGFLQPIVLQRYKKGYKVLDGKRRIKAARVYDISTGPAAVYTEEDILPDNLAVLFNEQRSSNWMDLFLVVQKLALGGMEAKGIAKSLQMPLHEIEPFVRMAKLPDSFITSLAQGEISLTLAKEISKRGQGEQAMVMKTVKEKGKATLADYKEIRRESSKAAIATLDALAPSMFTQFDVPYVTSAKSTGDGVEVELHENGECRRFKLSIEKLKEMVWANCFKE